MRSRWRRLLTFGYGIRRPSAPYRLAAHDWTCDRAIIALEHDLPFSSAYIFLFFLDKKYFSVKNDFSELQTFAEKTVLVRRHFQGKLKFAGYAGSPR